MAGKKEEAEGAGSCIKGLTNPLPYFFPGQVTNRVD